MHIHVVGVRPHPGDGCSTLFFPHQRTAALGEKKGGLLVRPQAGPGDPSQRSQRCAHEAAPSGSPALMTHRPASGKVRGLCLLRVMELLSGSVCQALSARDGATRVWRDRM